MQMCLKRICILLWLHNHEFLTNSDIEKIDTGHPGSNVERREVTEPPIQRVGKSEAGLRHEEQMRARAQIKQQDAARDARASAENAGGNAPEGFRHPVLEKFGAEKVAALTDPRVTAALHAKTCE